MASAGIGPVAYSSARIARVVGGASLYARAGKRVVDLLASGVLLVLVLPLLVILLVATAATTRQAPLFRQERVGRDGRPFVLLKLRTMRGLPCPVDGDTVGRWAQRSADDHQRVTRLGRVLRSLSLDELPQLWNVLRGHMSLVGPRPELPELAEEWEPWQRARVAVRPGLTGPWQVSPHRNEPMILHLEYDLDYVLDVRLTRDLRLLARTPAAMLGLGGGCRGV